MKLHQKILIHALAGHLILITLVSIFLYVGFLFIIERELSKVSEVNAKGIFSTLYQAMLRGLHRAELEILISGFQDEGTKVHLYTKDEITQEMLSNLKRKNFITKEKTFIYNYLIKADDRCLKCHFKAKAGDVLALLRIDVSIKEEISFITKILLMMIGFVTLAVIGGAYFIGIRQAKFINKQIQAYSEKLTKAKNIDDLIEEKLIEEIPKTKIEEVDKFSTLLVDFIKKVKEIAIDRRVFELEIKLLEKFILTSELIKDWKDYIFNLLVEINTVIEVPVLFSFFYVEDEILEVEIFWYYHPSSKIKKILEEKIKNILIQENFSYSELKFNHNLFPKERNIIEDDRIIFKLKKLLLQRPKIGGIVGVGVASERLTQTQELAIDGMLTNLINIIGSVKAISKFIKDIEYYATRDPLTNLYNQRTFYELVSHEIEKSWLENQKFSLLMIGLDNFKFINDSFGQPFADYFLKRVAEELEKLKDEGAILGRYGGDVFCLLLPGCDSTCAYEEAERIRMRVNNLKVETPDQRTIFTTCSIGVAVYPDHAETVQDLFTLAYNMMSKAKDLGKNMVLLPTPEDIVSIAQKEKDLYLLIKESLEKDKAIPNFQPIYSLRDGTLLGCELLMRIKLDDEVIPAYKFIPFAERLGLITKLDYIVIKKGLTLLKEIDFKGKVFINVSPKIILINKFLDDLMKMIERIGFPKENVVFELTERETVKNIEILKNQLNILSSHGFKFCIDDFGSGFSSFHYIKHLKVDYVKLEGDFVLGLAKRNEVDEAIVASILSLTKRLKIDVIAEFVENAEILELVRSLGVEFGQGFYLGKPSPDPNFPPLNLFLTS